MPAILIGAGHLGSVIAVNIDFPAYGFYLTGIFDIVPTVCGQVLGGLTVQHMTQLSDFCGQVHPAAAVLCIPEHAAKMAETNSMKKAGTDEMQFLLFLEFTSKYVKYYKDRTGNLWGFAEK